MVSIQRTHEAALVRRTLIVQEAACASRPGLAKPLRASYRDYRERRTRGRTARCLKRGEEHELSLDHDQQDHQQRQACGLQKTKLNMHRWSDSPCSRAAP